MSSRFFSCHNHSFWFEDRGTLKIYDPYFCMGNVVKQLGSLGCSAIWYVKLGGGFPDAFFWGGPRFDFLDIVFCCTVSIDLHFSQLSDHPMYIYRFTDFMKIVCQVFTMSTTNQWTSMQRKRYLGPILGSRLAKLVHITSITVGSIEGVTYSSWGF